VEEAVAVATDFQQSIAFDAVFAAAATTKLNGPSLSMNKMVGSGVPT
jgi:hypothetical protein